jgi:hypothetical protein
MSRALPEIRPLETMPKHEQISVEEIRSLLGATPGVLDALVRDLPSSVLNADEGQGTWSPLLVLGHLVALERTTWMPRLRLIFAGGDQRFQPVDREAMLKAGKIRDVPELLIDFGALRRANLADLEQMIEAKPDWSATAIHPEFGRVTAQQLLSTWVVHDLGHLAQICRVAAKHWKDDIGPWQQYLSIVHWNGSGGEK